MQYNKPALTFNDQADLLINRGLNADRDKLIQSLKNVNYYRLSGYFYPYRLENNNFKPNTNFEDVYQIYRFDRLFRLMILDAIERIEVSIRTQLTYNFSRKFGPFEYDKRTYFPKFKYYNEHDKWLADIKKDINISKEEFIKHFTATYGDSHPLPPLWITAEVLSFGRLLTMYSGVRDDVRKEVAAYFKTEDLVLDSWIRSINAVRNIAAHHSRLWNRVLGYKPLLPKKNKHPDWHTGRNSNDRIFIIILILRYLLKTCAPQSKWHERLEKLVASFPLIPIGSMGFPKDWKEHPIWNAVRTESKRGLKQ